jgi:4-hydroxy-tetrahydrodipicolinate reductase
LFGSSNLVDEALNEVHHTLKADDPSGTAYTRAQQCWERAGQERKIDYGVPEEGRVDSDHLYVTSQRLGSGFGEHQLRLNSYFDDIELTHRARSRDAFASGALQAARWIIKQKPGFYRIEDVVAEVAQS